MKNHHLLVLAGAALTTLLFSSCVGPAFVEGRYSSAYSSGYSGDYSGPYYGGYGPYNGGYGGEIIVEGRRYSGHYGDHHLYGQNFGRGRTYSRDYSGSSVRRGGSSKSHSSSRDRH